MSYDIAGASADRIATLTIDGSQATRELDSISRMLASTTSAADTTAIAFERNNRRIAETDREYSRLLWSIGGTQEAMGRFQYLQQNLNRDLASGKLSTDQYATALDRLERKYMDGSSAAARMASETARVVAESQRMNAAVRDTAAFDAATQSAGRLRGVMGQLSFQVQDVAVQLAGGQNALLVFAQQVSQAAGAFGPAGAAIGAVIAVAGAAGMALGALGKEADLAKESTEAMQKAQHAASLTMADGVKSADDLAKSYRELTAEAKALEEVSIAAASRQIGAQQDIVRGFVDQNVKQLERLRVQFEASERLRAQGMGQLDPQNIERFSIMRETFAQIDAFRKGGSVDGLVVSLNRLAQMGGETAEPLQKMADSLVENAKQSADLQKQWERNEAAGRLLAGTATDADRALLNMGESAKKSMTAAERAAQHVAESIASLVRGQRETGYILRQQYELIGATNAERARETAMLEERNRLLRLGVDVTQDGAKAHIAQAGELAKYRAELGEAASLAADLSRSITGGVDVLSRGGGFADAARKVMGDLGAVAMRESVTRPLGEWLTGTLTGLLVDAPPVPSGSDLLTDLIRTNGGAMPVVIVGMGDGGSAGGATVVRSAMNAAAAPGGDEWSRLVSAVIRQESNGNPNAVSRSGRHFGLMQIGEAAASDVGWMGENLLDPEINKYYGSRYLRKMIEQQGDLAWGLVAYNGGAENVAKWRAAGLTPDQIPWPETRDYQRTILARSGRQPTTDEVIRTVTSSDDIRRPDTPAPERNPWRELLINNRQLAGTATATLGALTGQPGLGIGGNMAAAQGGLAQLGELLGFGGTGDLAKSLNGFLGQTLYGGVPTSLMGGIDDVGQLGYAAGTGTSAVTVGNALSGGLNALSAVLDFSNGRIASGIGGCADAVPDEHADSYAELVMEVFEQ